MRNTILIILGLLLLSVPAWADVTLSSVSGTWSDVVTSGSTIYGTNTVAYGNTIENYFLSGNSSGRSGLGFTGATPPSSTFGIGDTFEIGQLRHFNNPTYSGTAPTSAKLTTYLQFSDPSGLNGTFGFSFQINNTPNNTGSSPADDDIVTFPSSYAGETFSIDGVTYTLNLLGFGDSPGNLISSFSSPENGTNSTKLWGTIATPPPAIPAPGAFLLGGIGVSLVGWIKRRRAL